MGWGQGAKDEGVGVLMESREWRAASGPVKDDWCKVMGGWLLRWWLPVAVVAGCCGGR